MQNWEVLKLLTEDPDMRFRRSDWAGDEFITRKGEKIIDASGNQFFFDLLSDDWEFAHYNVPWEEAIRAWIDGKNIKFINEHGVEYYQVGGYKLGVIGKEDQPHRLLGFNSEDFTLGKWYIL